MPVVVLVLLAAACSSGVDPEGELGLGSGTTSVSVVEPSDTSTSENGSEATVPPATTRATITTTTTTRPPQPLLPDECLGLDTPLLPTQLTYVAEGKLISLDLLGEATCLLAFGPDRPTPEIVEWGAQADRVMFSDGGVQLLGAVGRDPGEAGPDNLLFSWPTGFNMLWLVDGVINKSTVDARQLRELDVGFEVAEVEYHPDGQHLFIVAAEPDSEGSTVYVSNSEAEGALPLLFAGDAKISQFSVTADGTTVVFMAEHSDGAIHVHSLNMAAAVVEIPVGDDEIERALEPSDEVFVTTIFEAGRPINNMVFDSSGQQVAFAEGDCSTGSSIQLIDLVAGGYPLPIDPLFSARPVGFVTETQLAILVYDEDCEGGDLYVADTATGEAELIRKGVDSAAIRRSEPAALFSLIDVAIAGFA